MTIFSVIYLKLVFFLKSDKFYNFLFDWSFNQKFKLSRFYRPVNHYSFVCFFLNIIFLFVNKYVYFVLSKTQHVHVFTDLNFVKKFFLFLNKNILLNYNTLVDLVAVDYPYRRFRFELIYNIISISTLFKVNKYFDNQADYFSMLASRLFLRTYLKEFQLAESMSFLYNSASWLERKVWDFFGIFFLNNFNLRRILTDYGSIGHPLKKDYPVVGYSELYYDGLQRIIYAEPVEFTQELRLFNFLSPWELQSFLNNSKNLY